MHVAKNPSSSRLHREISVPCEFPQLTLLEVHTSLLSGKKIQVFSELAGTQPAHPSDQTCSTLALKVAMNPVWDSNLSNLPGREQLSPRSVVLEGPTYISNIYKLIFCIKESFAVS